MQETATESGQRLRVIETALALLLVLLLIAATFRVLLPFVGILTYAAFIATATSGLFDRMVDLLNGRRRLAAVLFGAVAVTITGRSIDLSQFHRSRPGAGRRTMAERRQQGGNSNLPDWIAGFPLLGEKATAAWQGLQRDGLGVLQQYQHQLSPLDAGYWIVASALRLPC